MGLIPATVHGLNAFECISAIQKYVRRSDELGAMECAVEMIHSSKAFVTMVCNRLKIVVHEDVDSVSNPGLVVYVHCCCDQIAEYNKKWDACLGQIRMVMGNMLRVLCRAPKSREGDHFQAAIGYPNLMDKKAPKIPDFALDKHTHRGRALGRGMEDFRRDGALLINPDGTKVAEDKYADVAYVYFNRLDNKPADTLFSGDA